MAAAPLLDYERLVRTFEGEARVLPMTGYGSTAGLVRPWNMVEAMYAPR